MSFPSMWHFDRKNIAAIFLSMQFEYEYQWANQKAQKYDSQTSLFSLPPYEVAVL